MLEIRELKDLLTIVNPTEVAPGSPTSVIYSISSKAYIGLFLIGTTAKEPPKWF
jgi:hypothetical protein